MAKNKEVFEYQAKISVDVGTLGQQINQVRKGLQDLEFDIKIPKGLKEDLHIIENRLFELQRTAPGAGSSSKDMVKYSNAVQKLAGELSIVSEKMHGIEIPDSVIKDSSKKLQELTKQLKAAQKDLDDAFQGVGEKLSPINEKALYKREIEAAKNSALRAAKEGKKGDVSGAFDSIRGRTEKKIVELESKEKLTDNQKLVLEKAKASKESIELLEKEILLIQEEHKKRAEKVNKLKVQQSTETNAVQAELFGQYSQIIQPLDDAQGALTKITADTNAFAESQRKVEESAKAFDVTSQKIKNLFSATTVFYTVRRLVQGAIRDFQELDKQFNEIAIVSDYSTKEMWKSFSSVNKIAQEFGVTTKNVLEVQNLYYHQGKDMAEVNKLTAQTLTLAKITGMDYERATSDLTAALNAYNIAAEDAVLVTDSIAAMDTNAAISSEELMTALTKTASIAANAGMSLQSTEVFLTKMIETTREAPENLGTALKTIIARFGEVKEEIDGEEIELADINKVDTALKGIGISLLDTAGQIRDLDGVFMELSAKWDDLDRNTQRYIATQAAGSRQQSRFIAMMEDYDRTLELTEIAQDSAGLGARQLAESMDSIETSMNRLKSTWQEFYANIINAGWIKDSIDAANGLLTILNKLPGPTGAIVAAIGLWGIKTLIVDKLLRSLGEKLGQGIAGTSGFNSAIEILLESLDDAKLAILAENKLLDENTREKIKNAKATRDLANANNNNKKVKVKAYKLGEKPQQENEVPVSIFGDLSKQAKTWSEGKVLGKNAKAGISKVGLKNATKIVAKGTGNALKSGFSALFSEIGKLFGLLGKIVGFLGGPLTGSILGVTGALTVATIVWKEFFKGSVDDTKQIEKLTKAQEEYNNAQKEYNNLKEKAKVVEKYRSRIVKSADETQEEQEAIKALVDEYPSLLESIDEEGNYHIKNSEAIEREIANKEKLLKLNGQEYTLLRTRYAQQGIYSDESTLAGAAMSNLKDFYATIEEDNLKDIAKNIDKKGNFNSKLFKEFAEAYASGEKTSFGKKDFSNLFGGTITENEDWNVLLETFGQLIEEDVKARDALTQALVATGEYTQESAEEVSLIWEALNEETGNLYNNLLEGASQEIKEINVQEADLYIDDLLDGSEITEPLRTALEEEFARYKQVLVDKNTRTGLEITNDFFGEQGLQSFIDGNKTVQQDAITKAEEHIKSIINDINNAPGGIEEFSKSFSQIQEKSQKEIENEINNFQKIGGAQTPIQEFILDALVSQQEENQKIINTVTSLIGKLEIFNNGMSEIEQLSALVNLGLDNYSVNLTTLGESQFKQLSTQMKTLGEEGGLNFVIGLNKILQANVDKDLVNQYLGTNVKDITSITETLLVFKKAGQDTTDILQDMVNAAGGLDTFAFKDIATEAQEAQTEIEALSKSIEGLGRLISGEGTLADVGNYMQAIVDNLSDKNDIVAFTNAVQEAVEGVQFTYDGIKISGAGMQTSQIINDYSEQLQAELAIAEGIIAKAEKQNELTTEETIKYQNSIAKASLLNIQYGEAQALEERQRHEQEEKDLKKEVDLLKKKRDALKELVDWMREYNRYQNLERISDTLDYELGNLEYEIEFSTNAEVLEDNVEQQLENINRNIAVNQAGMVAAKDDQAMWRDVIEKQNSRYVSFDESGNAIVNAREMQALQERIANLKLQNQEEQAEVLQAEYDGIVKNVEAYTKATEAERKYFDALQDNFKNLKKIQKQVLEDRINLEEKIIQVIQDQEDKELEAIKKKYEAINDENDKYLDNLQKMVDEERRIRDRADSEQEVKDKEKKLAMMKMDTSGIYASDIRALEKELEKDYRSLEDNAVDDAIDKLSNEYEKEAEARDQELTYYQNYLDEKREARVQYLAEAESVIQGGTENILNFLKTKDSEYITGSQAQQEAYILEWENKVARGVAASELMGSSLFEQVATNLNICAGSAEGFNGAVTAYSQNVSTTSGQINGNLSSMATQYGNLALGVQGVNAQIDNMRTAYNKAADAAKSLRDLQENIIIQVDSLANEIGELTDRAKLLKDLNISSNNGDGNTEGNWAILGDWEGGRTLTAWQVMSDGKVYGHIQGYGWIEGSNLAIGGQKGNQDNLDGLYANYQAGKIDEDYWKKILSKKWQVKLGSTYYTNAFKEGGYVDYTGPAWVDGTKSHPEYMLNATQTAQFESLIDALSMIYKAPKLSNQSTANSQKTGDSHMIFHINVEGGISSDYDVDKAVERIEKKILDSGKYRNTTVIKKSN